MHNLVKIFYIDKTYGTQLYKMQGRCSLFYSSKMYIMESSGSEKLLVFLF